MAIWGNRWRVPVSRCTVIAMNDRGGKPHYYWCMRHQRVETDENACRVRHLLGPYASAADAERALELVAERNEAWEAEDKRLAEEEQS